MCDELGDGLLEPVTRRIPIALTPRASGHGAAAFRPAISERDLRGLVTLLAGSQRIAHLGWEYEEAGQNPSYNEVWFDGLQYTYIYAISRPLFLDCVRGPGACSSNDVGRSDYFELQTDLSVDTTWGFTDVDFNAQFEPVNTDAIVSIDCATSTGGPGPLNCTSGLVHETFDPFTLDGTRLRGDTPDDDTVVFYLLSDKGPRRVPSLAIYSSRTADVWATA